MRADFWTKGRRDRCTPSNEHWMNNNAHELSDLYGIKLYDNRYDSKGLNEANVFLVFLLSLY